MKTTTFYQLVNVNFPGPIAERRKIENLVNVQKNILWRNIFTTKPREFIF